MNMTHSVAKFRILVVVSEIHCKLHIHLSKPVLKHQHCILPFAYKPLAHDKS